MALSIPSNSTVLAIRFLSLFSIIGFFSVVETVGRSGSAWATGGSVSVMVRVSGVGDLVLVLVLGGIEGQQFFPPFSRHNLFPPFSLQ